MKVLVSLGFYDDSGEGRLVGIDFLTGRTEVLLSYVPPPSLRVASRGFTGASLSEDGSAVYAAGHAAVYRISTRSWQVDGVLHIPSFNDLHHVAVRDGRLYIANTGSDSVDVFSQDGRFVGSHMLVPPWVLASKMQGRVPPASIDVHLAGWEPSQSAGVLWHNSSADCEPASPEDDYHTAANQRAITPYWQAKLPDRLHPNHTCPLPTRTLVTCLRDGSIRELGSLRTVYRKAGSYPHDGVAVDGQFYFTTIDGKLWTLPLAAATPADDGTRSRGTDLPLGCWDVFMLSSKYGWCRGLWIDSSSTGRTAAIGLTEVRTGRMPSYPWCERAPEGSQTGVVWMDLLSKKMLGWVDLSDIERHSKIYSVLPWSGA